MSEDDFSLFLISNGSSDSYPKNTLTHFKNQIPNVVNLEADKKFEMALESIGFSSNFTNVPTVDNNYPCLMITDCQKTKIAACSKYRGLCQVPVKFLFQKNESDVEPKTDCNWWFYKFDNKHYEEEDLTNYFRNISAETDTNII